MEVGSNVTPSNPKKRNRIASPENVNDIDINVVQTTMNQLEETENNLKNIRNELLEVKDAVTENQKTEKLNKTTKIIVSNHDIEHTDVKSLNENNIENFKIRNAKNSVDKKIPNFMY